MTDFETHPVGTAARIAELEVALALVTAREASRNHERLEALNKNAWQASRINHLEAEIKLKNIHIEMIDTAWDQTHEALTSANAATAAAYEVAAATIEMIVSDAQKEVGSIKLSKVDAAVVEMLNGIAAAIRALATPDQTAALDKLIADAVKPYAEALAWYGEQARLARLIHSEGDAGRNALQADGGKRANAILAASKKGGV